MLLLFPKKKIPERLRFVAVEAIRRSELAEQTVLFIVDTGGEEQGVRRAGSPIVPERERPQTVNGHDGIIGILQEADEFVSESVKGGDRSEEHTSELQSRLHLVCRLLLEKKKKNTRVLIHSVYS